MRDLSFRHKGLREYAINMAEFFVPGSTLSSLYDAKSFALPELPPNRYFDDPSTVDESLEHCSPVSKHLSRRTASPHLPTSDTKTIHAASTAPSRTHAPTTDELVQLILIDEVRAAEDRLDADRKAFERHTEILEEAWRLEKLILDQERRVLAVEKQGLAQREMNLDVRERALREHTDKLWKEEAIFRQQRDEAEQELQLPRTQRLHELICTASEEELTPMVNTLLLRLGTRGSSTNGLGRMARGLIPT
ncbi:hypothetical protein PV04_10934 [Phialophora macrospora]|uniref:Uncharacterized protein n=1 Tax=Phialophora macrospora TaxID=1851006 RepID=A0A0D2F4G5_9EURO|nr:hypothetical protein PV04_10934 [Phialophora macrospora]